MLYQAKYPKTLKNNPNWNKYGWSIIPQNPWLGGGFDMENINLCLDNAEVEDFVNNEKTTVFDVLSKNKLTWIFNGGDFEWIFGISDERVNKFLDYKDKGLGLVVTAWPNFGLPNIDYKNYVLNEQQVNNLPKDILWTNSFDKGDFGPYGSMSLIDDKGNLIWYRSNDFGLPDSFYFKEMDPILRKYLGEPSEHPVYQSMLYESTDFSQDGEIVVLQTASVGKGIDIVFTVDGLVDSDFAENGIFDRQIMGAMEYFFAVEPYKSLRDRFNVYAVKAVSVNNHKGYDHAFNQDLVKVWEYVSKFRVSKWKTPVLLS